MVAIAAKRSFRNSGTSNDERAPSRTIYWREYLAVANLSL